MMNYSEFNQLISQLQEQVKLEFTISIIEIWILFVCLWSFVMWLFRRNPAKKVCRPDYKKELKQLGESYRTLVNFYLRKIAELEHKMGYFAVKCRVLEGEQRALKEKYQALEDEHLSEIESLSSISSVVSENEDVDENEDVENESENENENEVEDEGVLGEVLQERKIWTTEDKKNRNYAHELPDGFKAYYKSVKAKKTMNLTFDKGDDKDEDRWIVDETGLEYKSINNARAAFFGPNMKKQSVWLHTRRSEDGKSLREVIEG